ncbi:MAG: YscQ/HrcQ family type III secretion apparatus protein [Acidobacteria bacterium]|nr:YscQ/HrcQ family type III secretion apparatus protein [Acidobacteriota bacterium]
MSATATPLNLTQLEGWSKSEAAAWNALLAALPADDAWSSWLEAVAAETLSRPSGRRPKLTISKVIQSDEPPVVQAMEGERVVLGRDAECDVVLPEKVITKQHAAVYLEDGRYWLEDLGSAMGVFRRNKKLEPHMPVELSEQDQFSIFPYNCRFEIEAVWAPEQDVALGAVETRVQTWADFEQAGGAGQLVFPLFVHPAGRALFVEVEAGLAEEIVTGSLPALGESAEAAGLLEVDRALLEVWLLTLADRLGDSLEADMQLTLGTRPGPETAWPLLRGVTVETSLRIRGRGRTLRLFLPFRTLERMRYAPSLQGAAPEQVSWRCRVTIATERFEVGELSHLEPGDVLLPDIGVTLWLPGEQRAGWRCTADAGYSSLEIGEYFETELDVSDQGPQAENLSELPVELHVVVGDKRLTFAEVQQLRPGSVIDLERAPDAPVELWANGARAGRGELVEIDGKLGVKVTEWLRKP